MARFDPCRRDYAPYGFSCTRWEPAPMRRPDHHNEVELNLLWRGSLTYLLGGRKVRVEAGRLSVFWAAIPHQVIDCTAEAYYVATIPFEWFLQFRLPQGFIEPLLRGEIVAEPDHRRSRLDQALFELWEEDFRTEAEKRHEMLLLEMEARLLRLGHSALDGGLDGSGSGGSVAGELSLSKGERMACFIAQHYDEAITVEQIARSVDLHPNYAMNLFKKAFQSTILDYLTQHRVSHAQRLLATSEMKVVEIAFDSGFNSLSRFNEAFRRHCGMTPREYRQRLPIIQRPHFCAS